MYFIRYRYQGDSVETAAEKVGVYKMVAYQWQDRWNEDGYAGLIPRFAGGKPAKLSPVKMERLMSVLKERDDWTTEEVQELIEKRFAVRFTQKHVRTILRIALSLSIFTGESFAGLPPANLGIRPA